MGDNWQHHMDDWQINDRLDQIHKNLEDTAVKIQFLRHLRYTIDRQNCQTMRDVITVLNDQKTAETITLQELKTERIELDIMLMKRAQNQNQN